MTNIKDILNSAISILKTIKIDYNSPIGPRTTALVAEVSRLVPLLKNEQPYIAECLNQSISNISFNGLINAYSFGDIRTALKILDNIYSNNNDNESNRHGKRIFISHSSKDRDIVEKFVDHILLLGIGLSTEDVFCTSIEDLAIRNGEDIRNHIHANIQNADFSILLISNNYKNSEICMNEMGAVWAYNNNVRYYLLPDSNFDTIGWLCNPNQAEKLFNSIALDALKLELSNYYSLNETGTTWSRQRELFLGTFRTTSKVLECIQKTDDTIIYPDPALDCNMFETKLLCYLKNNPNTNLLEISKHLGISKRVVNKTILSLVGKGFIKKEGTSQNCRWIVKS